MVPSPVQAVAAFLRARAHLMLTKAPKDAPALLIVVLVLGVAALLLIALASKLDLGTISF